MIDSQQLKPMQDRGTMAVNHAITREELLQLLQAVAHIERRLRATLGVSPVYTAKQWRKLQDN